MLFQQRADRRAADTCLALVRGPLSAARGYCPPAYGASHRLLPRSNRIRARRLLWRDLRWVIGAHR